MSSTGRFSTFVASASLAAFALTSASHLGESTVYAQEQKSAHGVQLSGDMALWTVAIRPDKTADFERVVARLRTALLASSKPERRQQAAGWTVIRLSTPLPDGNIPYVHVISPVVAGADYSLMQTLYEEFPDERQQLYELYKGAFAQNVALATGTIVVDMTKSPQQ